MRSLDALLGRADFRIAGRIQRCQPCVDVGADSPEGEAGRDPASLLVSDLNPEAARLARLLLLVVLLSGDARGDVGVWIRDEGMSRQRDCRRLLVGERDR